MCKICEYRRENVSFVTTPIAKVDLFYPFVEVDLVAVGAFYLEVCPDGELFEEGYVGDGDGVYPIVGRRVVGLYAPDTLLLCEAEAAAEELRKRGYLTKVSRSSSGWSCGAEQGYVTYALDARYLDLFDDDRATHQAKGLLLGYDLKDVLVAYPNK